MSDLKLDPTKIKEAQKSHEDVKALFNENKQRPQIIEMDNSILFNDDVIFHSQIDAAKDMIEALKECLEVIQGHYMPKSVKSIEAVNAGKAAILKAKLPLKKQ